MSRQSMMEKLGLSEEDFQPEDKTEAQRIKELEKQNEILTECLLELSEILYN